MAMVSSLSPISVEVACALMYPTRCGCTLASFSVLSIAAHAVTHDFSQNLGPAPAGKFQLLQNQDSGAFADHESVAPQVPWAAGLLRCIIRRGKRPHGRESTDTHGRDGGFGPAGDHHIGIATRDDLTGVPNGVRAGCASRTRRLIWSFGVVADADLSGGQIDDCCRDEER